MGSFFSVREFVASLYVVNISRFCSKDGFLRGLVLFYKVPLEGHWRVTGFLPNDL